MPTPRKRGPGKNCLHWPKRRHPPLHLLCSFCVAKQSAECTYGCCRTFERFLETASLKSKPGLLPRWKATKHKEVLGLLATKVVEGYTTENMQIMPYTSLEQAAAIDPAVDEIRDTVKVHSYDSLWRLLLQAHPGFKKTKVHMVGQRDPVQAQLAAKQLCGKVPMQFDYIVKARGDMQHHPLLQRVLCTSFAYTYRYAQLLWNVFLDAGKIEPQAWVKSHTAITHLGVHYERVRHQLLNLNVCAPTYSDEPCTL